MHHLYMFGERNPDSEHQHNLFIWHHGVKLFILCLQKFLIMNVTAVKVNVEPHAVQFIIAYKNVLYLLTIASWFVLLSVCMQEG